MILNGQTMHKRFQRRIARLKGVRSTRWHSDPTRVPPGQVVTDHFPVLHEGDVPHINLTSWQLRLFGLVEEPVSFTWEALHALPATEVATDVHCVTRWSKLDTVWEGVSTRELLSRVTLLPRAGYVLVHAAGGYTANLELDAFLANDALFAWGYEGKPLAPAHGWPLRLVAPQRYFWKSVKWVTAVEFLSRNKPGYWEERGYHMVGDPWREERFGW